MKVCSTCNESKSYSAFYAWSRSPDGYAASCKECRNKKSRNKYQTDSEYREQKNRNAQKNRGERREFVWNYLRTHPCVDCGNADIRVLEFDHVRGEKKIGITKAIQTGWDCLMAELPKCDVRCANCHRIKTYAQLGWKVPD